MLNDIANTTVYDVNVNIFRGLPKTLAAEMCFAENFDYMRMSHWKLRIPTLDRCLKILLLLLLFFLHFYCRIVI